jgi:branched-subunit amino acid aminotransferase/4-amino-4-deoxychorismate lyase
VVFHAHWSVEGQEHPPVGELRQRIDVGIWIETEITTGQEHRVFIARASNDASAATSGAGYPVGMQQVYLDGEILPEEEARIPATDPALAWGAGAFEVVRGYHRRPFQLSAHLERLERSAHHIGLDPRLPPLAEAIERLFELNGLDGGRIRITLTGGGHLIVVVQRHVPPPANVYERGAALSVAGFRRDPRAPLAGYKTLNYLENMSTRWDAEGRGELDSVVLGLDGGVLEGTRCNVFSVRGAELTTPRVGHGVLPGVTRRLACELAAELGIPVHEHGFTLPELLAGDEIFVTSTMLEVMPIARVGDGTIAAPGPITRALASAYRDRVERECKRA